MFEHLSHLPPKFLEHINLIVPFISRESTYQGLCSMRPSTFRVNTLKTTTDEVLHLLKTLDIEVEQVPWYTQGFILKNVPQKVLTSSQLYEKGYIYVQNLSSMVPPLVLNPQPGERILDIAAAPGSKTTQIAAMMNNSGELIANDTDRIRLDKLEANLKLQGVTNTTITKMPGQFIWKRFSQYFDKVLVDAPCSLEGRFYSENPKTYAHWSPSLIGKMALTQKALLKSALRATKLGGLIVYSTCTLAPEENEGVIDWLLRTEKNRVQLESIYVPNLHFDQPLQVWKKKPFYPQIKQTVRIFPSPLMEGFFIAKLRKLA